MFLLLRLALFQQKPDQAFELTAEEWDAVYAELKEQRVLVLLEPVLDRLPISNALRQKWKLACMQSQVFYHRLMTEQQTLLALFAENDIPAVIIKGSAAGIWYPQPELRCAGDVDILVKPKDYERAILLLAANCYRRCHEDGSDLHHVEFEKNGISPETMRSLLDYLLSQGNFGRKVGADGPMTEAFLDAKGPARLFRRLQNGGRSRWKAAQRHRVLRPFAWS